MADLTALVPSPAPTASTALVPTGDPAGLVALVPGPLPKGLSLVVREPGLEPGVVVMCKMSFPAFRWAFASAALVTAVTEASAWLTVPIGAAALLGGGWLLKRRARPLMMIVNDRLRIAGLELARDAIQDVRAIGRVDRELHIRAGDRTHVLYIPKLHAEYLARWLNAWCGAGGGDGAVRPPPPGGYWLTP